MINLGKADSRAISTEDLLTLTSSKLKDVIKQQIDEEIQFEKLEQYRRARRNWFYWQGIFDLVPKRLNDEVVDLVAAGIPTSNTGKSSRSDLPYNFNIIRGDFMKAIAVIGSKYPASSAVADAADDEDQLDLARRADLLAHELTSTEQLNKLQQELMLDLSITGTTAIWTPWRADGERFGYKSLPEYEDELEQIQLGGDGQPHYHCNKCGADTLAEEGAEQPECEECGESLSETDRSELTAGAPKVKGEVSYPNAGADFEIVNVFNYTTEHYGRNLKECEYFKIDKDVTQSKALEVFPDLTDEELEGADDKDDQGQNVRQQVSSETGTRRTRRNNVVMSWVWLRPSFFNNFRKMPVKMEDGTERDMVKLYKEHFKRGVRITMINGRPKDLFEESMDDCITLCQPTISKYIHCDPLCQDTVPVQDLTNRTSNIAVKTFLRGLPITAVDSQLLDREMMQNRPNTPVEMIPIKMSGMPIKDRMVEFPAARVSDQMMPFMAGVQEMRRDNNGITPPIFGGGPGVTTAKEAEIRKQQALMQLRVTYDNTRWAQAQAKEKLVRQHARYAPIQQLQAKPSDGVFGQEGGDLVELAGLADGKFHFEPDPGMPQTWEDEKAYFQEMVSGSNPASPELQATIGVNSPVNAPRVQKMLTVTGWYMPGDNERRKLRTVLQRLLQGEQLQPDPWDNHVTVTQLLAAWLSSEVGERTRRINEQGFQNVVTYWQASSEQANAMQPTGKLNMSYRLNEAGPEAQASTLSQFGIKADPSQLNQMPPKGMNSATGSVPPPPTLQGGPTPPEDSGNIPLPDKPIPGV